jgi:hypothetical protein
LTASPSIRPCAQGIRTKVLVYTTYTRPERFVDSLTQPEGPDAALDKSASVVQIPTALVPVLTPDTKYIPEGLRAAIRAAATPGPGCNAGSCADDALPREHARLPRGWRQACGLRQEPGAACAYGARLLRHHRRRHRKRTHRLACTYFCPPGANHGMTVGPGSGGVRSAFRVRPSAFGRPPAQRQCGADRRHPGQLRLPGYGAGAGVL